MKCKFCPIEIRKGEEFTAFVKPGKNRRSFAHLHCFLQKILTRVVDNSMQPTDPVNVSCFSICNGCRSGNVPVVQMSRTGQSICLSCAKTAVKLLVKWLKINNIVR